MVSPRYRPLRPSALNMLLITSTGPLQIDFDELDWAEEKALYCACAYAAKGYPSVGRRLVFGALVDCSGEYGVETNLESNRSQWRRHAPVKGQEAIGGHKAAEDLQSRPFAAVLLPHPKRVQRVPGDYSGGAAESPGYELFPPAAR
ncbi:transcription factor E2F dimerisation partner domain containing protein [Striga asiatica]|uniref:Transcription factor E2F dimerisation partner domain containing protein n=1 Tax=Striga asiatica TaxID=4170 RepID=A0A5A7R4V2_STRAF|nr:transcription factor E2F dimerisation partner domain containing protein [Striga asiatica]